MVASEHSSINDGSATEAACHLTSCLHCYYNLLSSTCLSQPLHSAVEGGGGGTGRGRGGGPSGGSRSEGEKEVGCSCLCCVCAFVWPGCVWMFLCNEGRLSQSVIQVCSKMVVATVIRFTTHL